MKPIPPDTADRFSAALKRRVVPAALHDDYRKWLRYYLDFREKYPPPPARSEQIRLFIQKLREKNQPPEFLKQAAHAISLFFETEPRGQLPVKPPAAMQTPKSDKLYPAAASATPRPVQIIESLTDIAASAQRTATEDSSILSLCINWITALGDFCGAGRSEE